jgi:hypothetical protein
MPRFRLAFAVTCVVALGGAVVVAACESFGSDDALKQDAGPTLADADASTTPFDATTPATDAPIDAPNLPTGCAKYPDANFCTDFESDASFGRSLWTDYATDNDAATLFRASDSPISPPFSAVFDAPTATKGCLYFRNTRRVGGTFKKGHIRFSIKPSKTLGIFFVLTATGVGATMTQLVHFNTLTNLRMYSQRADSSGVSTSDSQTIALNLAPADEWHEVSLDIDKTAKLTFDGQTVENALASGYSLRDPILSIGPYALCEAAARFEYDDVAAFFE